ncbi:MAG: hypothetical protein ABFC84_09115 [Veillonellales bacterium]
MTLPIQNNMLSSTSDEQSRQLYQDAVPRKTNVLEFKKVDNEVI